MEFRLGPVTVDVLPEQEDGDFLYPVLLVGLLVFAWIFTTWAVRLPWENTEDDVQAHCYRLECVA